MFDNDATGLAKVDCNFVDIIRNDLIFRFTWRRTEESDALLYVETITKEKNGSFRFLLIFGNDNEQGFVKRQSERYE